MKKVQIRIIIADDHEMVRQNWKLVLQENKKLLVIAECVNGAEAIELANKLKPDIMLMDVNMSPVNGFEATRKISEVNSSIKIIGISVNNQPDYARNMIRMGARGYVTKSSSPEEMITAILEVAKGNTYICSEIRNSMIPPGK